MDHGLEILRARADRASIGKIDSDNGIGRVRELGGRFFRVCPALNLPAGLMKQVGRGLADITASGNQNAGHGAI